MLFTTPENRYRYSTTMYVPEGGAILAPELGITCTPARNPPNRVEIVTPFPCSALPIISNSRTKTVHVKRPMCRC